MKKISALTTLALVLAAAAGNVAARPGHHDGWGPRHAQRYGRVVDVNPIYDTVEVNVPEQYCNDSYLGGVASDLNQVQLAGAVAGGVVGGLAGDQLSQGRAVMTVAGTVLGATIGYQVGPRVAEYYPAADWFPAGCETVDRIETSEELVGYRVKYRYRGHVYHTRTHEHPGKRIRVDRRARPIHF